jgi:hypothetical protein
MFVENGYGSEVCEFDVIPLANMCKQSVQLWAVCAASLVSFIMELKGIVIRS